MKSFLIGFVAAVVGLFVGMSMNWLLAVNINTSIWPLPEGIDPMDPASSEAFAEWIATLPGQAFILVFVAHVLQAGLGAFVAAAMSKSRTPAVVVIGLSVLGGVVNFNNLWEVIPLWMLLEFPVYFLLGMVGLRAGLRIRGAGLHGPQASGHPSA